MLSITPLMHALVVAGLAAPPTEEKQYLATSVELPKAAVEEVRQVFRISPERSGYVLAGVSGNGFRISIVVDNVLLLSKTISNRHVSDIDLSSLSTYLKDDQGNTRIEVSFKYGLKRDCFENDDGRNILIISFDGKTPSYYTTRFDDCMPKTELFSAK